MRYVILRDDDTNALTPVECLERLYRPFRERGLPVNLATIPDVSTDARTPEGKLEGFLSVDNGHGSGVFENIENRTSNIENPRGEMRAQRTLDVGCSMLDVGCSSRTVSITENATLVQYLRENGYGILQHGCHH